MHACVRVCMHPLLLLGIGKGDDLTDTSDEVRAMKRGREDDREWVYSLTVLLLD